MTATFFLSTDTTRGLVAFSRPRLALALLLCSLAGSSVQAQNQTSSLTDDQRALLVLNRLAYGPRPDDIANVEKIGVKRWIEQQLAPDTIPMPPELSAAINDNPVLSMSEAQLFIQYGPPSYRAQMQAQKKAKAEAAAIPDTSSNVGNANDDLKVKEGLAEQNARQQARQKIAMNAWEGRLQLATDSPRQLQEVMTEFWFNHFNVFEGKGLDGLWVGQYENQVIRPRALGNFRDLLGAVAHSGAMLFYLDNWLSSGTNASGAQGKFKGLNENYGRELLELHTMGVGSGYTQQDVIVLARALSGWTIGRHGFRRNDMASVFDFDASRHDDAPKTLLGITLTAHGEKEGEQALDLIASQPATAHFLAQKMVSYFISCTPDAGLVEQVAQTYQHTNGDIRSMLKVIFNSSQFWQKSNYQTQFKTPYQFVVSALRAGQVEVRNPRPVQQALRQLGQPVYGWQTPEGYKFTPEAWMTGDALLKRIDVAEAIATGRNRIAVPALILAEGTDANALSKVAPEPVNADLLLQSLSPMWSDKTMAAVAQARGSQRAALLLGSPDFMKR